MAALPRLRSELLKKEGLEKKGKRWSKEEEDQLLEEVETLSLTEIATIHRRTVTAIHARLCQIAIQAMIAEDATLEEIEILTKLRRHEIEKFTATLGRRSGLVIPESVKAKLTVKHVVSQPAAIPRPELPVTSVEVEPTTSNIHLNQLGDMNERLNRLEEKIDQMQTMLKLLVDLITGD